jgi:uncharacterized membrane protein YjgN (DUF898 family)
MESGLSTDRTDTIKFSGQSGEYFKLWFVNMFLSIITLGIYSAWAKVRNTQYMYGHTQIDGHSFRYLASPIQILKGRIIAVIVFVTAGILSSINPLFGSLFALLLFIASPWLIIQGLRFTLRMTAYRNVRFSFEGSYDGVIVHFILLPILGLITFYLAMPWVIQKTQQFMRNNITYGGQHFEQKSSAKEYYRATLHVIVFMILASAALGITFAITSELRLRNVMSGLILGAVGAFIFAYIVAIFHSIIYNHLMKTLKIEDLISFDADIKAMPLSILLLKNLLLLVMTFGLAYPIVKIRTMRFFSEGTFVTIEPAIDQLINTVDGEHSAFGEEAAGLFDTDLSIV